MFFILKSKFKYLFCSPCPENIVPIEPNRVVLLGKASCSKPLIIIAGSMNIIAILQKTFNWFLNCFGYILFIKNNTPKVNPIKFEVLIPETATPRKANIKILAKDKFFVPEFIKYRI